MDRRFALLSSCFLLSGASALVFETLWAQEFGLVFGASELAVVAVLAAYMTGLAAGAAAAAPWAERTRRPLRAYAFVELAIGACALVLPAAIGTAGRLEQRLFQDAGVGTQTGLAGATIFHLLSAFLILLVPTGLMGATLPLLVGHAVRGDDAISARVALLYAANTLGAAAGAVWCAFFLLPWLGLGRASLAGAALNALVALLALGLSWRSAPRAAPPMPAPATANADLWPRRWPLWVVACSGAVALGQEVFWTRLCTHVVGGSIYAFATMLAAFLVALALGAAAAASRNTPQRARSALAWTQLIAGLSTLGAFALSDRLPAWVERLASRGHDPTAVAAFACASLMLPGAACLGAAFPLCVRLLSRDARAAPRASSRALAWNTAGAVVGVVVTGVWALPALRFSGYASLAAAVSLALAGVSAAAEPPRSRAALGLVLVGLAWVALAPPPTPWRLLRSSPLAALQLDDAPDARPAQDGQGHYGPVEFYAVGRSATVLLHEEGAEWRLTGNGLPESAVEPQGARPGRYGVARWLTLLPGATRSGVRRLLVVGLGAGHSVEDLPPSIESADVVELEPEIVRANRFLAARRRRDPLADGRVRVHLGDARSALRLGRELFDAVVSQPSHPWTAGSAHLFTREFFELARARLRPGGVFVQWMGLQFVDEPLMRSLVASLRATFSHVEVFQPYPWSAALFVASDRPLETATQAPAAVARDAAAWRQVGVRVPEDVWIARVLDDEGTRALAAQGGLLNDDHHNRLQTRAPLLLRELQAATPERWLAALDAVRRLPPDADGLYVVRRLAELRVPTRALRAAAELRSVELRHAAFALMDAAIPRRERTADLAAWFQGRAAGETLARVRRGWVLALRRALLAAQAPPAVNAWAESDPEAAVVLHAWRLEALGEASRARALESGLAAVPPRSPLFRSATEARIAWRLASGEAQAGREALELLDPLLALRATAGELLLRARLAAQARDAHALLASLDEVSRATFADASARRAAAREALALLDAEPSEDGTALRERLRARARADAS